ncbi:MAG TPA: gamma-glutamylcyclotransferase family protein [Pyrinomonadaceae bacterium]|nr:gamma-glutamylcyclotransferase family protein [Pyrinomonadaceae bacterium]
MKTMTEQVFVYGTLKFPDVQREIIGREVPMVSDTLNGFISEPVVIDGTEYRALVPLKGAETEGAIITVTTPELDRIDAYEPDEYKRIKVTTVSGRIVGVYVKA